MLKKESANTESEWQMFFPETRFRSCCSNLDSATYQLWASMQKLHKELVNSFPLVFLVFDNFCERFLPVTLSYFITQ